jgi:hypothetical protein
MNIPTNDPDLRYFVRSTAQPRGAMCAARSLGPSRSIPHEQIMGAPHDVGQAPIETDSFSVTRLFGSGRFGSSTKLPTYRGLLKYIC